jgi:hypothetical protein
MGSGLFFFFFLNLINRGGQQTVSEKVRLTVTFDLRRLQKPSWLTYFAHLD